jgi:hypothetical protein
MRRLKGKTPNADGLERIIIHSHVRSKGKSSIVNGLENILQIWPHMK